MKDYIFEKNGKWHYCEWLEPESRGWVTHSFDTKEQAEAYREGRENPGLAKMAGKEVERVDGLAEAIQKAAHPGHRINFMLSPEDKPIIDAIVKAARIQLKRQGE